jgi:AcrR family transcriptional regulator
MASCRHVSATDSSVSDPASNGDRAQGRTASGPRGWDKGTAAGRSQPGRGGAQLPSKSERTRQRILDAAAEIFRREGYAGARLSDIAALAGMQTGSLYYHFDSREALVEEVLRLGVVMAWGHVREALAALPDDLTPLARLEVAIRAHAAAVLEISNYTSANARIFGQAPAEVRQRHFADQQSYGAYWNDLIEAAVTSGELRADLDLYVVRMLLFGAMNWAAEWYRPDRGRPATLVAEHMVAMVLDGLKKQAPEPPPNP